VSLSKNWLLQKKNSCRIPKSLAKKGKKNFFKQNQRTKKKKIEGMLKNLMNLEKKEK